MASKIRALHPDTPINDVEPQPIDRSFDGIRKALFEDWEKLREGRISTERARTSARMADAIIGSVNTQLVAIKFNQSYGQAPLLLEAKKSEPEK